jgi:hypothetical protein
MYIHTHINLYTYIFITYTDLIFQISEDQSTTNKNTKNLEFFIELKNLICLGFIQLKDVYSFPINTVLFVTDNELYITDKLYENLKIYGLNLESNRGVRSSGKRTSDDDGDADFSEVSQVRKRMDTIVIYTSYIYIYVRICICMCMCINLYICIYICI